MPNWHNEVLFDEEGFTVGQYSRTNENSENSENGPGNYCRLCGTTTGLHSFSFDKEGRY